MIESRAKRSGVCNDGAALRVLRHAYSAATRDVAVCFNGSALAA